MRLILLIVLFKAHLLVFAQQTHAWLGIEAGGSGYGKDLLLDEGSFLRERQSYQYSWQAGIKGDYTGLNNWRFSIFAGFFQNYRGYTEIENVEIIRDEGVEMVNEVFVSENGVNITLRPTFVFPLRRRSLDGLVGVYSSYIRIFDRNSTVPELTQEDHTNLDVIGLYIGLLKGRNKSIEIGAHYSPIVNLEWEGIGSYGINLAWNFYP